MTVRSSSKKVNDRRAALAALLCPESAPPSEDEGADKEQDSEVKNLNKFKVETGSSKTNSTKSTSKSRNSIGDNDMNNDSDVDSDGNDDMIIDGGISASDESDNDDDKDNDISSQDRILNVKGNTKGSDSDTEDAKKNSKDSNWNFTEGGTLLKDWDGAVSLQDKINRRLELKKEREAKNVSKQLKAAEDEKARKEAKRKRWLEGDVYSDESDMEYEDMGFSEVSSVDAGDYSECQNVEDGGDLNSGSDSDSVQSQEEEKKKEKKTVKGVKASTNIKSKKSMTTKKSNVPDSDDDDEEESFTAESAPGFSDISSTPTDSEDLMRSDDEDEDDHEDEDLMKDSDNEVNQESDKNNKKSESDSKKPNSNKDTKTQSFPKIEFSDLGISRPFLKALSDMNFREPTEIQQQCIPLAMEGHDLLATAETGSGKSAAFILPIVERISRCPHVAARQRLLSYSGRKNNSNYQSHTVGTKCLILTPTRELATQLASMLKQITKYSLITSALIAGGFGSTEQAAALRRQPDILICTPGRILDHLLNTQSAHLELLEIIVLDEADRLLENLGFRDECEDIMKRCCRGAKERQTLLFSATFNSEVKDLASVALRKPVRVEASPVNKVNKNLRQEFVEVKSVYYTKESLDREKSLKLGFKGKGNEEDGDVNMESDGKDINNIDEKNTNSNENSADDASEENEDDEEKKEAMKGKKHAKRKLEQKKKLRQKKAQSNAKVGTLNEEESRLVREATLLSLCQNTYQKKVIVFFQTKKQAHRMACVFGNNLPTVTTLLPSLLNLRFAELHGNLSQSERCSALDKFQKNKVDFLLATDLASRGLDIPGVETVINFEVPDEQSRYIHRVGRTARMGNGGQSVTLYSGKDEYRRVKLFAKTAKKEQNSTTENKESNESNLSSEDNHTTTNIGITKRIVAEDSICTLIESIRSLEQDLEEIQEEEKEERELRLADVHLSRAENIQKYEKDIKSRPKKNWLMTNSQKRKKAEEQKEVLSERKRKQLEITDRLERKKEKIQLKRSRQGIEDDQDRNNMRESRKMKFQKERKMAINKETEKKSLISQSRAKGKFRKKDKEGLVPVSRNIGSGKKKKKKGGRK